MSDNGIVVGIALGLSIAALSEADDPHEIYSEDKTDAANPKPTLYVEYEVAAPPTFVAPNMIKKAIIR